MSDNNYASFSKSLYDTCNLKKKDEESMGPFNWITDNVHKTMNCDVAQSPFQHTQLNSIPSTLVDKESDLRNQTRPFSRCPEIKYKSNSKELSNQCDVYNQGFPCNCNLCSSPKNDCNDFLLPSYTRLQKPCDVLSGISINRFDPLFLDSQDINTIHNNSYIGSNTRLEVKDAFKNASTQKNVTNTMITTNITNTLFPAAPYKI